MKNLIFKIKNWAYFAGSLKFDGESENYLRLTEEARERITLTKLKKLFVHAKETVPFYTESFKDFDVNDIKNLRDWNKLPIVTREDILANVNAFKSKTVSEKRFMKVTTGGSTGKPLTVYHDRKFPVDVVRWRVFRWWGIEPSSNAGFVYRKVRRGLKETLNSILWYPTRRVFLDASLMTSESMYLFYKKLLEIKPHLLQGYVGGIYEFAKYCKDNQLKVESLKAVWVTAAPLTPYQRSFIEETFNSPVYDQYGCSEIFWIASECKLKKGLHVFSDIRHVEVLDENNDFIVNSDFGKLCITDLENYAFPLIRYINGDRGRWLPDECSCGVKLPLIDNVKGRVSDLVRMPNGNSIAGEFLTTIFDEFPDAVKEFRIHQKTDYSIVLTCVLGSNSNATQICEAKVGELRTLTDNSINIELDIKEDIMHDNGKTRFIISDIKI